MFRTDSRSVAPRTAGRVTPLNAATLLLLVTMVLASSPAAPRAAFTHPTDPRPVSTGTVAVETDLDKSSPRRRVHSQEHELAAAWWRTLVAGPDDGAARGEVSSARCNRPCERKIRPALIDLPPPLVC